MATLRRVFAAVDAGFEAQVLWRGAGLDRLVDADHARLAGIAADRLRRYRWDPVLVETTYSIYGERGSIDVFGGRREGRAAVVEEIKTSLASIEATLRKLDEKARRCAIASRASGSVGSRDPSDASWCYRTTPQRAVLWRDTPPPSTSPCPRGAPMFADGCASRREIWPGSCSWIRVRASSWTRPDSACAPPPPDIAEGDARSASLGSRAPPTTQGDRRGRAAGLTDPSIAWSDIRRELAAGAARTPPERPTGRRSPRLLRSPRRDPHP